MSGELFSATYQWREMGRYTNTSSSSLYKGATQIALQGYTVEYDEKYPGKE